MKPFSGNVLTDIAECADFNSACEQPPLFTVFDFYHLSFPLTHSPSLIGRTMENLTQKTKDDTNIVISSSQSGRTVSL